MNHNRTLKARGFCGCPAPSCDGQCRPRRRPCTWHTISKQN